MERGHSPPLYSMMHQFNPHYPQLMHPSNGPTNHFIYSGYSLPPPPTISPNNNNNNNNMHRPTIDQKTEVSKEASTNKDGTTPPGTRKPKATTATKKSKGDKKDTSNNNNNSKKKKKKTSKNDKSDGTDSRQKEDSSKNAASDNQDGAADDDDLKCTITYCKECGRKRAKWSDPLHIRFLKALEKLGPRAVPSEILQEMKVPNLTREQVASHLQKYRKKFPIKKDALVFRDESNAFEELSFQPPDSQ